MIQDVSRIFFPKLVQKPQKMKMGKKHVFNLFDFLSQYERGHPSDFFRFTSHLEKKVQSILFVQKIVTSFCKAFWIFLAIFIGFFKN